MPAGTLPASNHHTCRSRGVGATERQNIRVVRGDGPDAASAWHSDRRRFPCASSRYRCARPTSLGCWRAGQTFVAASSRAKSVLIRSARLANSGSRAWCRSIAIAPIAPARRRTGSRSRTRNTRPWYGSRRPSRRESWTAAPALDLDVIRSIFTDYPQPSPSIISRHRHQLAAPASPGQRKSLARLAASLPQFEI